MSESEGRKNRLSWHRWGGKWVWPGKNLDRGKTTKAIFSRFWYLLMPVIGIVCSQGSYVRPHLVEVEDTTNREKKVFLDQKDNRLLRIDELRNQIYLIEDEMDTTVVPQIAFNEEILDSLVQIRRTYDQTIPQTEALVDSLQQTHDGLKADAEAAFNLWKYKETVRDSLTGEVLRIEDDIVILDDSIRVKGDRVYRILNPGEFRKTTALFPGEGDYPERDSLPPKQ
jgi:hypothetical protein